MRPALLLCALAFAPLPALAGPLPAPELIGEITLPTGLSIQGVPFGGLSDLSYDARSGQFVAISDAHGDAGRPRIYDLRIAVENGRFSGLDILSMQPLSGPEGADFGAQTHAGGVVVDPAHDRIFWSAEDDAGAGAGLFVAQNGGGAARAIPLPPSYASQGRPDHGVRSEHPIDALDLSPDGHTLIAATEEALAQDGPVASYSEQSPVRLLMLDSETGQPRAEYIYYTDTIPARPTKFDGPASNGLTALAALPDGRLVTVERGYAAGVGNSVRFYIVSTKGASNVAGEDRIDRIRDRPVHKALWFALSPGMPGIAVDDLEDIAFGPVIGGRETMLTASDNNFNRHQATRFKLFTVDLPQPMD
ncbi:hypothetical protein TP2_10585 [Thioclava pacifica DSM 10166]|uniref:Phytase-like domain-containing protein n=2 Tax=Thioclava pacifica TaxID=285109 RepID=A0A074J394_9RHOB|nr:hypothetical protein TP2_10585 [Thioclava pacifica DSM 10166]